MINERAVYISMQTSRQYLHSVRRRINEAANRWWSVNPQLLIISDNESLWKLINIWNVTARTSISCRGREVTAAIDARRDLYPSRTITQSLARPGSLGNFVPLCQSVTSGCVLFGLLLVVKIKPWIDFTLFAPLNADVARRVNSPGSNWSWRKDVSLFSQTSSPWHQSVIIGASRVPGIYYSLCALALWDF